MKEHFTRKSAATIEGNNIRSLLYVGMSMYPTLRNLDLLSIAPTENTSDIKKGDIIVFRSRVSERMIAHRVTGITIEGFRTRGDNMGADDLSLTSFGQIIGKVDYLDRGLKSQAVNAGFSGMITHYVSQLRRKSHYFKRLKSWVYPLIKVIHHSKLFRSSLSPKDEIRTYVFTHPDRTITKSFQGNILIESVTEIPKT